MTLHALSSPELTKLRSGSHWSIPMLVIPDTPAIFKARINQSFTSRDRIYEITYDTVTLGAYTDVKSGMTLLVGTAEGLADIGVVRIRKSPTATKLFIGQTSDVKWANSLYLTVVRDYGLFTKQAYTNKTTQVLYMDRDIAYSDQHANWKPFVNMGGDRVIWLEETSTITFNATAWVPGSTISSWSWSSSGGTWTNEHTAAPTLTLETSGTYQIDCTVTADNGETITGHRLVVALSMNAYVVPEPHTLTLQPQDGLDVYAQSYPDPDANYGGSGNLYAGIQAGFANYHSWLKFDLSSLPVDATITGVTLIIYNGASISFNTALKYLYRVKRNWITGQLTWNSYNTGNAWETPGALGVNDIETIASGSGTVTPSASAGTPFTFTLDPSDIQGFLDGTFANYGWMLGNEADGNDACRLYSSRCGTAALCPKLVINYTIPVTIPANAPITDFTLDTMPSWDFARGGWEFGVTMRSGSNVRDRQRVFLIAKDFYNGAEGSIGQVEGCENIIAAGWIAGESLSYGSDDSSVTFDVYGAHYWLGNQPGSLVELTNTGATSAAKWSEISALTVDLALCHMLHWRSTAPGIMDVTLTGDTRQAKTFQEQAANLWDQMASISGRIKAVINTDCINGLYAFIDPQSIPVADRGAIPVIMAITKPDWETVSIERVVVNPSASLRLVGERFISPTTTKNYYSVAAGNTPKRFGYDDSGDSVLVDGQTQLNNLTGLTLGQRNNPYPEITLDLTQNNRGITGVPAQYITLDLEAADNPRGIAFSGDLIPRAITHEWDEDNKCFLTTLSCEAACVAELAVKDEVPAETPPPPIAPPAIEPPTPPIIENPSVSRIGVIVIRDSVAGIFYTDQADESFPLWKESNAGLPYVGTGIYSLIPTGAKNLVVSYGMIYADQEEHPDSGVWGAPLGGTFQQILTHEEIQAAIGDTETSYQVAVAVSPFDDSVAVIAQCSSKMPMVFVGTSAGGFVAGAELPFWMTQTQGWSTFSYGDGVWRITRYNYWETPDVSRVLHISLDGSTIAYDSGLLANNWPSGCARAILIPYLGTGPGIWFPANAKLSLDNGQTWADTTNTIPANAWGGIATNADRSIVMWGSDTPISTDGGESWNTMPGLPGWAAYSYFAFYPGSAAPEWLASVTNYGGAASGVYNSLDDGATWAAKTGDLLEVMGVSGASIVEIFGI